MKLIPAIDLKDNKCVRLTQGKEETSKVYNENPVDQAKYFEKEGCGKIHIVDLDAAFGRPETNKETIINIKKSVKIPIQLGGGIRSKDDVNFWLEKNFDYLIIGTLAVTNSDLVNKIAEEFENKIYIALDIKQHNIDNNLSEEIMVKGWTEESKLHLTDITGIFNESKIKGYILTSINNDGMMEGPSLTNYDKVHILKKPVIFSGGFSHYSDLEMLSFVYDKKEAKDYFQKLNAGFEGVIVGKAIYSGALEIKKAIKALNKYAQS